LDRETWNQLNPEDQTIITLAALIPPPISLDFWAKAAASTSVKILQLAENLVQSKVMKIYEPMGVGNYCFCRPEMVGHIIQWAGEKRTHDLSKQLLPLFESMYSEGPHRVMAFAYLCQISHVLPPDLSVLIQAAEYCLRFNLRDEAATYYQIVIDSVSSMAQSEEVVTAYIDAVIGLCLYRGRSIPLQDQGKILSTALSFAKTLNDPDRLIAVLVLFGQVCKTMGKYDQAAEMFEQSWDKANIDGREILVKRVALATTDFLMWQGRLSEAIDRYEKVLGNLEELPADESSLQACAQLGWIYGKCGQTVRGIGLINSVMVKATELSLDNLKVYSKIIVVLTLLDARRNVEAEPIVDELLAYPQEELDQYVLWPLCASKAYILCLHGEYEASFQMQNMAYAKAKALGNFHHRGPWNFEYIDILEDAGFMHPEMNYESEVNRVINWPDVYMQGVGYYYRARRTLKNKGTAKDASKDLHKSLTLLNHSGAKLDLSFAQILLAQLMIQEGERDKAELLLKEAWRILRFVNKQLFPEELKHLVVEQGHEEFLLEPLIEISETIGTLRNRNKLLNHIITLTLQLTGAERGAFFLKQKDHQLEMVASRNLEPELINMGSFSHELASIDRVLETGEEIIRSNIPKNESGNSFHNSSGWQIIYPVKLQDKVLGSFFLEKNLIGSSLPEKISPLLKVISTQVAVALDNVSAYEEIAELKDQLEAEAIFYRSEPSNVLQVKDIIGDSAKIKEMIAKIYDVAQSNATALIIGETGVGKELVAKAIHQLSNRSSGPFIPVSIASLSKELIASELFGHEKGAFTNALRTHRGRFELANEGTLFLDEVNSLSLDIQAKLLRVLEEKKFERAGGNTEIKSNFSIIAASNQPLNQLVKSGVFRSDLYYRLNVYPITVPPLRERKEDIPLLVSHFVQAFNEKFGKSFKDINKSSLQRLMDYSWPGNVRELKHAVERAVISCKKKQLSFSDFNAYEPEEGDNNLFLSLNDMERQYIIKALALCAWKISGQNGAAKLLDLKPQTLYSKIKRLGIKKRVFMEHPSI
jgi:transcriptional regulator with GAF, ATPase, and Fis domain